MRSGTANSRTHAGAGTSDSQVAAGTVEIADPGGTEANLCSFEIDRGRKGSAAMGTLTYSLNAWAVRVLGPDSETPFTSYSSNRPCPICSRNMHYSASL